MITIIEVNGEAVDLTQHLSDAEAYRAIARAIFQNEQRGDVCTVHLVRGDCELLNLTRWCQSFAAAQEALDLELDGLRDFWPEVVQALECVIAAEWAAALQYRAAAELGEAL